MVLIFFDNQGNPIPLNNNIGVINIKPSSIGLINTHQLFLMEKIDVGDGMKLSGIESECSFHIEVSGEGFYMTTISEDLDGTPLSVKNTNIILPPNFNGSIPYDNITGYRSSGSIINQPHQIHLSTNSQIGGVKNGIMKVSKIFHDGNADVISDIWEFNLYTELIEEDPRFVDILANMGEFLSHQHELIFKNSDINEDLPDLDLLNRKRKEFLTEIRTISPLSSTIRGIEAVIDLFDYKNILTIKEYWYNDITNKISIIPIGEADHTKELEKLNRFGFFYNINEPTEEVDVDGLPILKDNFIFTNDEIVIKLSALKEYFISKDIGGISDISDIVGEIYNFNALSIRQWRGTNESTIYENVPDAEFLIITSDNYIIPIRKPYKNTEDEYSSLFDLKNKTLFDLKDHQISYFSGYLDESPNMFDNAEIEVGCRIELLNNTFKDTWDDAESNWDVDPDISTSWKNIGSTWFYKTIWTISKSDESDGRSFVKTISGDCSDMARIFVTLPYDGFYDVKIENIGFDNTTSCAIVKKALEVKLKDPNFLFIYRITNTSIQDWEGSTMSWEESSGEWSSTKFDNTKFKVDNNELLINKFRTTKINNKQNKFVNQKWMDSDLPWNDLEFISFDDTEYLTHRHPKLHITSFNAGGILIIGESFVKIPKDFSYENFGGLCELLKNEFENEFDFIPRKLRGVNYIEVQRAWYSDKKTYDISSNSGITLESLGGAVSPSISMMDTISRNGLLDINTHHRTHYQDDPFTMDNTRMDENKIDVPIGVPFFMSVDNSDIAGKNIISWEVREKSGKIVSEYVGEVFGFMPLKEGFYDLHVNILDKNDNKYALKKDNIIKVMSVEDFREIENKN